MRKTFIQLLGELIVVGFFKWAATHIQREREIHTHIHTHMEREREIDTHMEREREQDRERERGSRTENDHFLFFIYYNIFTKNGHL